MALRFLVGPLILFFSLIGSKGNPSPNPNPLLIGLIPMSYGALQSIVAC